MKNLKNIWTKVVGKIEDKLVQYKISMKSQQDEFAQKKAQRKAKRTGSGFTERVYCSMDSHKYQSFF